MEWDDICRRKKLADRVAGLGCTEHLQILRILHSNGVRYTRNNNGVFCDISRAPAEVLSAIDAFIDYSKNSAALLEEERRSAAAPPPKAVEAKPRAINQYRTERVKAFASSIAKTKVESTAMKRKEACKFQQLRKKYIREVSSKSVFSNDLRPE